jgi:hypothetical protein
VPLSEMTLLIIPRKLTISDIRNGVEKTVRGSFSMINKGPWEMKSLRIRWGESTITNVALEDGRAMEEAIIK